MHPKVFISYQRADSGSAAGRIYDNLSLMLGKDSLFKDVDSILIGQNFEEEIAKAINECMIFLIIVGKNFNIGQELKKPNNYVRIEIETALSRNKPIIPIFVDGGLMPELETLPSELHSITKINGAFLRNESWGGDFEILFKELKRVFSNEHQKILRKYGIEIIDETTGVFTDQRDQMKYNITKFEDLWWFTDNLRFNFSKKNEDKKHYNEYYTIGQIREAIPMGWRLPTKEELHNVISKPQESVQNLKFIPTGFYDPLKGISYQDMLGFYWSGSKYENDDWSWYLAFNKLNESLHLSIAQDEKYFTCRCVWSDD